MEGPKRTILAAAVFSLVNETPQSFLTLANPVFLGHQCNHSRCDDFWIVYVQLHWFRSDVTLQRHLYDVSSLLPIVEMLKLHFLE
jgi:hypothetical protein